MSGLAERLADSARDRWFQLPGDDADYQQWRDVVTDAIRAALGEAARVARDYRGVCCDCLRDACDIAAAIDVLAAPAPNPQPSETPPPGAAPEERTCLYPFPHDTDVPCERPASAEDV